MMPQTVYLCGPMSGLPGHNFDAFKEAAKRLRYNGFQVTSPVEMDEAEGFDCNGPDVPSGSPEWAHFLARDVARVADPAIEAVVVLPGWERSRVAALEVHVARELGKPILRYAISQPGQDVELATLKQPTEYRPPSDENVLEEASRLVSKDRGQQYGHPADDFARTAGAWRALFGWDATPGQVALALIVVKLSRLQESPAKRDSIVDIAGYARAYEVVLERDASG